MNILIIEDEERNFNRLRRMLEKINPTFQICGPTTNIVETVEYLRSRPTPNLILADIRLSDGLSFEVFKQVQVSSPIIFTTAYDEYAVQAFKYNSIDYLLKPIDAGELAAAIEKATQRQIPAENGLGQLLELMQRNNYKFRERFLLPYRDGYKMIRVKDVNHIYTENRIVRLYLNDGTSEAIALSMDELESQLNPDEFFRANRQYIVQIDCVDYVGNYFNSKLIAVRRNSFQSAIIN